MHPDNYFFEDHGSKYMRIYFHEMEIQKDTQKIDSLESRLKALKKKYGNMVWDFKAFVKQKVRAIRKKENLV